ncbi:MAG: PAS domain-containing sensor histidine kinase [Chloroflexi bacterium]|nr:PAS domain-containing sensor histidine kinase [Chloroflexota bacterium]
MSIKPLGWSWSLLRGLPSRFRDRHFWYIQAAILSIATLRAFLEFQPTTEWYELLQPVMVILYIVPISYSSIRYGWEGGLLTSLWVGILTVPNLVLWHRGGVWAGELMGIVVVAFVGTILAWRTDVESRLRKKVEAAMRDLAVSEARYQGLFENAGDAILVLDANGQVVSANAAASVLTGYSREELVGMNATTLLNVALLNVEGGTRYGHPSAEGPFFPSGEIRLKRKEGSEVYVEAVCTVHPGDIGVHTQAVLRDITARRHRELGLRAFLRQVTRAQEEERKRIARDLHDETAQNLALLRRELQDAMQSGDMSGASSVERLKRVWEIAGETLRGVRRFTSNLRPPVLDDLGIVAALETLVSEVTKLTGVEAHLEVNGSPHRLDPEAELMLFRIVQEALRNVQKHAQASRTTVTITFDGDALRIDVEDNGKGFDTSAVSSFGPPEGHLGLTGMAERAGLLGAEIHVSSKPGEGTHVSVLYGTKDPPVGSEKHVPTGTA